MVSWTAISQTEHSKHNWKPRAGFEFAADQQLVEVCMTEISVMLPHYALGFTKEGEEYRLIALIGLGGKRNLYVNMKNQWLCPVVPAVLRGYPFGLASHGEDGSQRALCIDASHLTDSTSAEVRPLFKEDAELTDEINNVMVFLNRVEQERLVTRRAAAALDAAGLIEPWPISINRGEGQEPIKVEGLFRINEKALNELSGEQLKTLQEAFALPVAYAQLFSSRNIQQLAQRAGYLNREIQAMAAQQAGAGAAQAGGDEANLFSDDGGSLNFDALGTSAEGETASEETAGQETAGDGGEQKDSQ